MKTKKLLFLIAAFLHIHFVLNATIWYVKVGGTGDGSSWNLAAGDIQFMINTAVAGDEVWVAGGTHKPGFRADLFRTYSPNNRNNAIALKRDVKIYGGFPNTGNPTMANRNHIIYPTIISGDFSSNDVVTGEGYATTITNNSENAYHVVISAGYVGNALLDGFTIRGGNANETNVIIVKEESVSMAYGGGMYIVNSTPTIINCKFIQNASPYAGAGMYIRESNPTITNVSFNKNKTDDRGGGLFNSYSNPVLNKVSFLENGAKKGAGIYNLMSNISINEVAFTGNGAIEGGGLLNEYSSPTLTNTTFTNNLALKGGGIYNFSSSPVISYSSFLVNSSELGGGICNSEKSTPILTNLTIKGNLSSQGGGIYNENSTPTIINTILSGNIANNDGGGLYNSSSSPTIINSTISGNKSDNPGGGITNDNSSPNLQNSIILGNSSGIENKNNSFPDIQYCLVQEMAGNYNGNVNGIGVTPQSIFTAPLTPGGSTGGDYSLKEGVIAVNSGYTVLYEAISNRPDVDLANKPRVFQNVIDMGAYESQIPIVTPYNRKIYVVKGSNGNGSAWYDALGELADALKYAKRNQNLWTETLPLQIWVSAGIYHPLYSPRDGADFIDENRDNAFLMVNNVQLYGGFNREDTSLDSRNRKENITILSGNLGTEDNTNDDAYHVVISAGNVGSAIFDGFTIMSGNADGGSSSIAVNGFEIAREVGGGMVNVESSPLILNNKFIANSAKFGGGMHNRSSSPVISNTLFSGNNAVSNGGGMHNQSSEPNITNSTLAGNKSALNGGGIFNLYSNTRLFNSIVLGNNSGIHNINSTPYIQHSLVQSLPDDYNGNLNGTTISKSEVFISPIEPGLNTGGDYSLKENSPVINKGNNSLYNLSQFGNLDLIGENRIANSIIDLGPYEYNASTNISAINENEKISVYPNPITNGVLSVTVEKNIEISLYNIRGIIVKKLSLISDQNNIPIKDVPSGLYLLRSDNSEGIKVLVK